MVISLGWLSPATSMRPTRSSGDPGRVSLLTWPCSDWGLPCRACYQTRGGLLPHLFTLTLGYRAVCSLWPVPSPCGAQALPGSLPCGARTFLSAPLRPAHRDHHALPPPTGKVSVSEGSGQASARQPSQQANQAIGRESSGSLRARRLPGEPEAVVLLEHHAFQARPVTGPQQRRRELDGVHAVQPPRPEQRQHVTRLGLGREQEERSVGQGEPLEQAEREPIGRRLGETESEVDIAPLA